MGSILLSTETLTNFTMSLFVWSFTNLFLSMYLYNVFCALCICAWIPWHHVEVIGLPSVSFVTFDHDRNIVSCFWCSVCQHTWPISFWGFPSPPPISKKEQWGWRWTPMNLAFEFWGSELRILFFLGKCFNKWTIFNHLHRLPLIF